MISNEQFVEIVLDVIGKNLQIELSKPGKLSMSDQGFAVVKSLIHTSFREVYDKYRPYEPIEYPRIGRAWNGINRKNSLLVRHSSFPKGRPLFLTFDS